MKHYTVHIARGGRQFVGAVTAMNLDEAHTKARVLAGDGATLHVEFRGWVLVRGGLKCA